MMDRINIAVPTSEETMIMQINLISAIERAIVDYYPHLRNPAALQDPQLPSFTIIIRSNDAAMRPQGDCSGNQYSNLHMSQTKSQHKQALRLLLRKHPVRIPVRSKHLCP
jgi:hypothetical protein